MDFTIYCDDLQEGLWFKNLNRAFNDSAIQIIPTRKKDIIEDGLLHVLKYDRPDIILKHNENVILVIERTIEVPSGHNVGQRFGRLVAAAENRIPVVYFGPYAAYKHGGATAGPRYMNLRLFYALEAMSKIHNTAITTINWPVDSDYEIVKNPSKDERLKVYLDLFLSHYSKHCMHEINESIMRSNFQKMQKDEQISFAKNEIRGPEQYDIPPESVSIINQSKFRELHLPNFDNFTSSYDEFVLYNVGMTYVRSDPYAGMSALYKYLYVDIDTSLKRALVLNFPHINTNTWKTLNPTRKDYRMFKEFSNGIIFKDGFLDKDNL